MKNSIRLLSPSQRVGLGLLLLGRLSINFLDVLAVGLVGLLGIFLARGSVAPEELDALGLPLPGLLIGSLVTLATAAAALFILKSTLSVLFLWMTVNFLARIESSMANEVVEYIFMGSLSRMRRFSRGEAYFSAQESVQQAVTGLLTSVTTVVTESFLFILMFGLFLVVDPFSAALIGLYFITLVIVFQFVIRKRLSKLGEQQASSQIMVANVLSDWATAWREITIFGGASNFLYRFRDNRKLSATSLGRQTFILALPRYFVESALMIGVLILAGVQLSNPDSDQGVALTALFLAGGVKMVAALLPIQHAYSVAKFLASQSSRAQTIIKEARALRSEVGFRAEETPGNLPTSKSFEALSISVKNLSYSYPETADPALKSISLEIGSGQHVALVGPSGAGKSTLADLILGLNNPSSGHVLLGGKNPLDLIRENPGIVAYVPQEPGIVGGSIAENVALGVEYSKISESRIQDCIDAVNLGSFVDGLPDGIHSNLGKQSDALSVGQKQRLGVARALYPGPKLIVLDEATSSLDAKAEADLTEMIIGLKSECTLVVIAHRLSTIQNADCVYVIDKGQLVAQGTFSEVRKSAPLIENYVRLMSFD